MNYYLAIKTLVIFVGYFSYVPKCSQYFKQKCSVSIEEFWLVNT